MNILRALCGIAAIVTGAVLCYVALLPTYNRNYLYEVITFFFGVAAIGSGILNLLAVGP